MKSRHTYAFKRFQKLVLNASSGVLSPATSSDLNLVNGNVRFAATFWQPFIDIVFDNDSKKTHISGPLLGLLFEIAKKLMLRYVVDFRCLKKF